MPDKTLFVVTPTKVHAFKARIKGRGWKVGDEVAVWDRGGTIFVIAALATEMFGLGGGA